MAKKMRDAQIGHAVTEETRKKMAAAKSGTVRSEESKAKQSASIKAYWERVGEAGRRQHAELVSHGRKG
jgi:hypothetical protein